MRHFLERASRLRCTFLLVDARHGLMPADRAFLGSLRALASSRVQVVMTKCDLLYKHQLALQIDRLECELRELYDRVLPRAICISAKQNCGLDELRMAIVRSCAVTPATVAR